jgi:hypothetical protein
MRRHKTITLLCLLNTIALQLAFVLSAYTMALAIGMKGPATLYFMCVPLGYLIAAIPIAPPQAFGIMEWAFIQFFTPGGINTASQAVTFALATRVIQLVWALPGVLVPLLGAHLPTQAEREEMEQPEPVSPELGASAADLVAPSGATPAAQ